MPPSFLLWRIEFGTQQCQFCPKVASLRDGARDFFIIHRWITRCLPLALIRGRQSNFVTLTWYTLDQWNTWKRELWLLVYNNAFCFSLYFPFVFFVFYAAPMAVWPNYSYKYWQPCVGTIFGIKSLLQPRKLYLLFLNSIKFLKLIGALFWKHWFIMNIIS